MMKLLWHYFEIIMALFALFYIVGSSDKGRKTGGFLVQYKIKNPSGKNFYCTKNVPVYAKILCFARFSRPISRCYPLYQLLS